MELAKPLRTSDPDRTTAPRRRRLLYFREIGLLAGAYFTYMLVRKVIVPDAADIGFGNANEIISLEKTLGLFWEPIVQRWAMNAGQRVLVFFNYLYILTFVPIVLSTALILYIRDRQRYFYYRGMIMLSFVAALLVFAAFPLAPPRFVSPDGIIDSIATHGPLWYAGRDVYYNAFAAMPSLHFSWALVFGVMYWRSGPWWLKTAGVLYPAGTLSAIVITGNHYILDAVVGSLMMLVVYLVYERREKLMWWRSLQH